jgi:hypothetical protein
MTDDKLIVVIELVILNITNIIFSTKTFSTQYS